MSFFDVVERNLYAIEKENEIFDKKVSAYMEMASQEYDITVDRADLASYMESGEDSEFMYEEAQETFITKAVNGIKTIIERVKQFFKDLKDKIVKLFTKKDVAEKLNEAEKKAKRNPIFGKKKVQVYNGDAEEKAYDEHCNILEKLMARLKHGDNVTEEDLNNAEESFIRKHAKIITLTSAVAVGSLIALARKKLKSANGDAEKSEGGIVKKLQAAIESVKSGSVDKEKVGLLTRISNAFQKRKSEKETRKLSFLSDIFKKIFKKGKSDGPTGSLIEDKDEDTTIGQDIEEMKRRGYYGESVGDDWFTDYSTESYEEDDWFKESAEDDYEKDDTDFTDFFNL